MKGMKKAIGITFKRNKNFSLIFLLVFTLISLFILKNEVDNMEEAILKDYLAFTDMDKYTEERNGIRIIDDKLAGQEAKKLAEKKLDGDKIADLFSKYDEDPNEGGDRISFSGFPYFGQYESSNDPGKLDYALISPAYFAFLIALALIISLMLFGNEYSKPYHEFLMQAPWKRETTYFAKIIYGMGLMAVFVLIYNIFKYSILKSTSISEAIDFGQGWDFFMVSFLFALGFFMIFSASGSYSGNAIGHLGLSFIASFFILIIYFNIDIILSLFGLENASFIYDMESIEIPEFLGRLLYPIGSLNLVDGLPKIYQAFQILLVGLIHLIIGALSSRFQDGSRLGYCVQNKRLSNVVMFLAIITTSSLFIAIFSEAFGISGLLLMMIYLVLCYLFYRLYKIIFNLNISY